MSVDRSWMYRRVVDRVVSQEFKDGVESFIQFALGNPREAVDCEGCIRCPCAVCENLKWISPWEVQHHLYRKGFVEGYMNWTCHGEKFWLYKPTNVGGTSTYVENSTKVKANRATHPEANIHTSGSISLATHRSRMTKELKRAPTFQEAFDQTHKKKGTDQYISKRAREVAEPYNRHMNEKYREEGMQQLELDPDVWVSAAGAPKKGHTNSFGQSLDTSRVISSSSSSSPHATGASTTPHPPPNSSSIDIMGCIRDEMLGLDMRSFIRDEVLGLDMQSFIQDEMSRLEMRLSQIIQSQISDAVQAFLSQALSGAGIPLSQRAPLTAAQPPHDSSSRGTRGDKEDMGKDTEDP